MLELVNRILEDRKAVDVSSYHAVETSSGLFEWLVVCTGTSTRHINGIVSEIEREIKRSGDKVVGVEGEGDSDWVLIDLGSVVVHVMTRAARKYYDLDTLWSFGQSASGS